MGMDSVSLYSSKQGVPESSRDIMNGHISDMKGNSSAGAAEDSSGLHKASRHHMTESDAVGDKYGLAVERRHKGHSVVCPGRQAGSRKYCHLEDNVSPVWKCCLSRQQGPQQCQVVWRE